jgi:nicotinamide phosphoribosyltransferase
MSYLTYKGYKGKYKPKVHETPRMLKADAYTIGSNLFQSIQAKKKSVYYITFRRELFKINPALYTKGDNRILFYGLQRIIHRLFYEPFQKWEIESSEEFLATAKVNSKGELSAYHLPKELWTEVVEKYNGIVPIKISAVPEGSVIYPNEPAVIIQSLDRRFDEYLGELAAWFESKLLHCWATTERGTQDRHMYDKVRKLYRKYFPNLSQADINFFASIVITDFGDRAGMNEMESEDLGMTALYTFGGSDTFCGGYQAWMNSNKIPGVCTSVYALAHRNVQAFDKEDGAYNSLYDSMEPNDFGSMVNDCYASRNAVLKYHIPLAIRSMKEGTNKVIVTRPDSGDALDEVMWTIQTAIQHGLFAEVDINNDGNKWFAATTLHYIEGDGLSHENILNILTKMLEARYIPWSWGLFGFGGGQRNNLKRDNTSAKYALCAIGDEQPVVKFSDTFGKTTLPGPMKLLRSKEALEKKQTIVFTNEPGENYHVIYFDGSSESYFDYPGMEDDFNIIKTRSHEQFDSMPLSLSTDENHGYPASDAMLETRRNLLQKYAPEKNIINY